MATTNPLATLRALVGRMTPGHVIVARGREGYDVAPLSVDAGMRLRDAVGVAILANLREELLAVVEAAQREGCPACGGRGYFPCDACRPRREALATLTAAIAREVPGGD